RVDLEQANEFARRLRAQPEEVRVFVNKALFHWTRPRIAEIEDRPFEFYGIPLHRGWAEPYHPWPSENHLRELLELVERFPRLVRTSRAGPVGKPDEGNWFVPGGSGFTPARLMGDHEPGACRAGVAINPQPPEKHD